MSASPPPLEIWWYCWGAGIRKLKSDAMPHPYINDPKYWRERAEEARSISELLEDPEAKRQILAIAASYDRLADHLKQPPTDVES